MRIPDVRLPGLPLLRIGLGTLVTAVVLGVIVHPAVTGAVGDPRTALAISAAVAGGMVLCVLVHEIAHALVAQAFGGKVDHIALTLWGGHTQYTSSRIPGLRSMLISLAGPASNLLLAAAMQGIVHLMPSASAVTITLAMLVWLNTALAIFNLLPGLPMDGGRALEGLLSTVLGQPYRAAIVTAWIGRAIAVAVIALPLWRLTSSGVGDTTSMLVMLWGVLISMMLWNGASGALTNARAKQRIERLSVDRFATWRTVLDPAATVDRAHAGELVLDRAPGPHGQVGHAATIDPIALDEVPLNARETTAVQAVSMPLGSVGLIPDEMLGSEMLTHMLTSPHAVYLVVEAEDDGKTGSAGLSLAAATTQERSIRFVFSADVNRFLRRG